MIALCLGVLAPVIFISFTKNKASTPEIKVNGENYVLINEISSAVGCSNHRALQQDKLSDKFPANYNRPLTILSKPRANYTAEARKSDISGTVRLRVTFSASGQVTSVQTVSGLPYGLTEEATVADGKIQFQPEIKNGTPVSVNKTVEYNFNLY